MTSENFTGKTKKFQEEDIFFSPAFNKVSGLSTLPVNGFITEIYLQFHEIFRAVTQDTS